MRNVRALSKLRGRHLAALSSHDLPLPVPVHKDICPDVVAAAVLAFVGTLFDITGGHDGHVAEHPNLDWIQRKRL